MKYPNLFEALGLDQRRIAGKLRTVAASEFLKKIAGMVTDIEDRGEKNAISASLHPPVIRALADSDLVQVHQITNIDQGETIYTEQSTL